MKALYYAPLLALFLVPGTAPAEEINGFDPTRSCSEVLGSTRGSTDQFMIAAWVFGYLAAQNEIMRPVSIANNQAVLGNLIKACADSGGKSLLDLVKANKPSEAPAGNAGAETGPAAGSEAEARALLSQFLQPNFDRHALTWSLKANPEEVREVYAEPLATKLIATYDQQLTQNVAIGPKPGQTNLLTWFATTDSLKRGGRMLEEFPGGYGKVAGYFKGNHPIVRFKFVEQGETLGMAFDGLIYVGGRWVWMPKPWRSLD